MAMEAPRRVVAGADGVGSGLKDNLVAYLKEKGIEVDDLGVDKYYSIAVKVASELAKEKKSSPQGQPLSRGLLVCGTGVGVSIFANKFGGVYAAPCNSVDEALNARSINNTNVLTLGAKVCLNPGVCNAVITASCNLMLVLFVLYGLDYVSEHEQYVL